MLNKNMIRLEILARVTLPESSINIVYLYYPSTIITILDR